MCLVGPLLIAFPASGVVSLPCLWGACVHRLSLARNDGYPISPVLDLRKVCKGRARKAVVRIKTWIDIFAPLVTVLL